MPRLMLPILFLLVLAGALYFLSTVPRQQPTTTVEVDVAPAANAR